MKNYISINGEKIELSDERLKELGFMIPDEQKTIDDAIQHGKIKDVFRIGELNLKIIGINHDCNDENPQKQTITVMSTELLPPRRMHSGSCKDGWSGSELREYINEDYINDELPVALISRICPVRKITHDSRGNRKVSVDKIFVLSESELFGSAIWSDFEEGKRYEAFNTRLDRMTKDDDGDYYYYWTRSLNGGIATNFCIVNSSGHAISTTAANTTVRVPLCFTLS